jgi:hypothetical protein
VFFCFRFIPSLFSPEIPSPKFFYIEVASNQKAVCQNAVSRSNVLGASS